MSDVAPARQLRSRVLSVGSALPERVVRNEDLRALMDTSDEWIVSRSGIRERRWVEGATTTSDLGLQASRDALARAGLEPKDIDMILFATLSPDHEFPGTACFLQAKLGLPGIPAIDVRQQCTGFIHALSIADAYLRTGQIRRALVVGAEVHSKGLDVSTRGRDVAVLFGDGAGAAIMEATEVAAGDRTSPQVYSTHLHADGTLAKELWIEAPSMARASARLTSEDVSEGRHFPKMNGKTVFLHAVRRMPEAIREAVDHNGYSLGEVDLFVLHQANLRINEAAADQLGIPRDRVFNTIERLGNTTAATIPLGLAAAEAAGRLKPGMLVATAAFGSGFTWASALIRW